MKPRIGYENFKGVFALIPTPTTEKATDEEAEFTVDLESAADAVARLVKDGVDGIMLNGTLGEAATLTRREWEEFSKTVTETIGDKAMVIGGPTALSTYETIQRARFCEKIGMHGIMVGRPMWCELGEEATVEFYRKIAEKTPSLAIVIYDNPSVFKGRITLAAWRRLAEIPQVAAVKYTGFDVEYIDVVNTVKGRIRVMPMDRYWYTAYTWFPSEALACWSSSAACGPLPVIKLKKLLLEERNLPEAEKLTSRIAQAYRNLYPKSGRRDFHRYNIIIEKTRTESASYMRAGPPRPPYHIAPKEIVEQAKKAGEDWRRLVEELQSPGP